MGSKVSLIIGLTRNKCERCPEKLAEIIVEYYNYGKMYLCEDCVAHSCFTGVGQ